MHLRGCRVRALSQRSRAADGMAVHTKGEPKLAVRAAAGLLEHGRGAAGHEVGRFSRHQTQPVPRAQHRQPSLSAVEVHGHQLTERDSVTTFETCGPTQTPDDIDIDALREKYLHERDKRLRPEGSTQYLELKGEYAEFSEVDPHTPVTPRTPIAEDVEVAVLGGGIAGLLAASHLKKA